MAAPGPRAWAAVYADFGPRRVKLQLNIAEIGELERACGAGIAEILIRFAMARFTIGDVRETIRYGLIGGGMARGEADALIAHVIDESPLQTHVGIAEELVRASVYGVESAREPEPGNSEGEGSASSATSPRSTQPESSSD